MDPHAAALRQCAVLGLDPLRRAAVSATTDLAVGNDEVGAPVRVSGCRTAAILRIASTGGGVGLWELDLKTGRARWDRTLRGLLGVGPAYPASFASWLEFVPPEDRHLVEAHHPDHLVERDLLCRVVAKDGTMRHLLIRGHKLEGDDDAIVVGTAVDVTAVAAAQGHVITTLEALNEAYIATDGGGVITHVNARAMEMLGRTGDELIGQPLSQVLAGDETVMAPVRSTASSGTSEQVERWVQGFGAWLEVRTAPHGDGGVALFLRDIGNRKQLEEQREELLAAEREAHRCAEETRAELERRGAIDEVTEVWSRAAIERAALDLGTSGGHLISIDVDGFGRINEVGGWDTGDDILREVADRLRSVLTEHEVVGRRAGDNFLVVTEEEDPARVSRFASDLSAAMEAPFEVFGHPEALSVSIGIAVVDEVHDARDALHGADAVVSEGQGLGGARILWYDDQRRVEVAERRRLGGEIRQALGRDQFVLRFQPVFATESGRYAGVEALLRWEHPERGLVLPETFLPVADQLGLLGEIERWVVDTATSQLGRWIRERDPERRRWTPPVLWVNVSQGEMQRTGFADRVLAALRDAGIDPSRFGVEFVPQSGLALAEEAVEVARLHDAGVRIGIDDIGAGSGNITSLRGLPIDVVKVDERLTAIVGTRRGRALLRAVVQLARALDAEVVAEGVERPEQLVAVREAGCELASGFLLGRPVANTELAEVVTEGLAALGDTTSPSRPPGRSWRRLVGGGQPPVGEQAPVEDDEVAAGDRDGATGLGTRQAALALLQRHFEEGRRPVLILIELDGFQAASLVRGPIATVALLRAVARRLHEVPGARAFRVRDGQFALVLPDTRRGPTSSQVDLVDLATGPKGMTACVGVAHATARTANPQELESRAEQALETAQRRGTGSVNDSAVAGPRVETATASQVRALHAVLREGYLRVHYQPILSLADGSLVGFQALARPQLDHGLVGPVEAFDVAESIGLVAELDAVCRSSVFADGPGFDLPPQAKLFVTVEPRALGHKSLRSGRLLHEVRAGGLTPERVVLQVREHSSVPADVLRDEARWLKERGFGLALADAGGASSGLAALADGAFDHLKFATNLLADSRQDDGAAAMVEALCAFAERSKVQVIATGIENPRLLTLARRLREQGDGAPRIHAVQGYHLGKPRPQPRFDGPVDPRLRSGGWGGQQTA